MKALFRKQTKSKYFYGINFPYNSRTNKFWFLSTRRKGSEIKCVYPLYTPKVTFFNVKGKVLAYSRARNHSRLLKFQTKLYKNKVCFKVFPSIPFVYLL